jgi:2-dehydro-3-deoxy-D-arabinonate dehydratase
MKIYKTNKGILIESDGLLYAAKKTSWDAFLNQKTLFQTLKQAISEATPLGDVSLLKEFTIQTPIQNQEVWAAGVTYLRSRDARMDESKESGGDTFYDKVYAAVRPEIFFKATAHRCVGTGQNVRIRQDSTWNVPEPELTLVLNKRAEIVGYTIGNDMSSRSIEGENPLYLPQAKSYDGSAAIGPCVYVSDVPIPSNTKISMTIKRRKTILYEDNVEINRMKRTHTELVEFLFRECSFPYGCLLMTGTCLVPANDFTLHSGDEITISIDHIGTLINYVK